MSMKIYQYIFLSLDTELISLLYICYGHLSTLLLSNDSAECEKSNLDIKKNNDKLLQY